MIIDTHAHLMFEEFSDDIEGVLERARVAGVGKIINIACDLKGAKQAVAMADAHEELYATVGLHPYESASINGEMLAKFGEWIADNEKVVAIGECGLDYAKCEVPPEDQKKAFRMQLDLASELEVPVVVHNREADEDTLAILQEFPDVKVV
ncbi:TatD family hydrolase, partial [Candidatus Gracilibacteria bacterium]|nr:TatD family hydrolase [Candidatus Gracilibacteria bacterium]